MALTNTDVLHLLCLDNVVKLSEIRRVCDLGQQDIVTDDIEPHIAHRFAERCGNANVDIRTCRSSAEMWNRLGRAVVSLDVVGDGPDFHRFDLNQDSVPLQLNGQFDLVTNIGTSEHVFNQLNVFKVIHDLVCSNGVIFHSVPICGFTAHGMYNYTPKMFGCLAKANDYRWLDMMVGLREDLVDMDAGWASFIRGEDRASGVTFDEIRQDDYPWDVNLIIPYPWDAREHVARYRTAEGNIRVLFVKSNDQPFHIPVDLPD